MRLKHEILGLRVGVGGCEEGNLLGVLVIFLKYYSKFHNFEQYNHPEM